MYDSLDFVSWPTMPKILSIWPFMEKGCQLWYRPTRGGNKPSGCLGAEGAASEAHQGGQCGWSPTSEEERDKKGSEEPGPMVKCRFLGIFKNMCRYHSWNILFSVIISNLLLLHDRKLLILCIDLFPKLLVYFLIVLLIFQLAHLDLF